MSPKAKSPVAKVAKPTAAHQAVIVAYARTPFTPAHKGALAGTRPDEFTAQLVKGLLAKVKIDPADLEDLILGCAFPEGEQGMNAARLVGFLAGLPLGVAGVTLNRFCGSSMQAIHMAAGAIASGAGEAFLCVGMESMSRIPMGGYNPLPHPGLMEKYPAAYIGMGETAENVADRHAVTREDQEAFAVLSHQKAARAAYAHGFAEEIIPVKTDKAAVDADGCIRPETTPNALAALKPAFKEKGTVTAGTSSPLTDGAAAVLVTSAAYARAHKLPVLARIVGSAVSGCAPEVMGMGPVEASRKALARAGITVKDLDVVELNEAFSAQALAVIRALKLDESKINLEGGAIALGHPLGASGARITGKAAQLLKATGGRYALATQCIGGGQGIATVLEAVK